MKRNFLKSIAIIAAFLIGVAINHSCGESVTDDTVPPTEEEMWNIVRTLRTEIATLKTETSSLKEQVAQLKAEVAALKSTDGNSGSQGNTGGSGSNSDCNEFFVDGLYFNRAGYVTSKQKSHIIDNTSTTEYYYDDHGRISRYECQANGFSIIYTYKYSGKTVTYTANTIYDPTVHPNLESTTSTIVYEYY